MSWYYVDTAGQTKGPVDEAEMKKQYAAKTMTDSSYVWNGTTVNDWTPLSSVSDLHSRLKPKPAAAPKRPSAMAGGAPRRRSPMGGGGMAGLLGDIRKGKTLKKAESREEKPKPGGGGGGGSRGGGGGGARGGGRPLTMQEQMAAVLARRRGGGGGGGGPKPGGGGAARGGGGPRPSPVKKSTPAQSRSPVSPRGGAGAKKSFGGPKPGGAGGPKPGAGRAGGSTGPSMSALKSKIKGKLDRAEDWQLKAIAKILE